MNFKVDDTVKLKTFNGCMAPIHQTYENENYWKLIGHEGIIIKDPCEDTLFASFTKEKRLCVKFKVDLSSLGLINHNNVSNSLWILKTDLELV